MLTSALQFVYSEMLIDTLILSSPGHSGQVCYKSSQVLLFYSVMITPSGKGQDGATSLITTSCKRPRENMKPFTHDTHNRACQVSFQQKQHFWASQLF